MERWQTAGHRDHDVLSFAPGASAVVAGNGACLWHQLGLRLSVGGVVHGMGGFCFVFLRHGGQVLSYTAELRDDLSVSVPHGEH